MKTPICDFVEEYREKKNLRLHMPGHKGKSLLGFEALDITEIDGADVLYSPKGIIRESEENAGLIFGSERTLYSVEGSSLSIRAMLYLASLWGKSEGKNMTLLATRNAHRVFMSGCALLDLDVRWMWGDGASVCSCNITSEELDSELSSAEAEGVKPFAVYLTSPDYLGNTLDIKALSAVCHKHGLLCLVDNAHGAYLNFLSPSRHPMALGADMCADSAHKTLPALTGAAYLHVSKIAPRLLSDEADRAMSLLASTSPSYLILQSLDAVNKYLSEGYSEKLEIFSEKATALKKQLSEKGFTLVGDEPLKLTISTKPYGYKGFELCEILASKGVVCEFCDKDFTVMMLTPEISDSELSLLSEALLSVPRRAPVTEYAPVLKKATRIMSVRESLMAQSERLPIEECEGRILSDASFSCPPAIPILVCGELIDKDAIKALKYYGISECKTVM